MRALFSCLLLILCHSQVSAIEREPLIFDADSVRYEDGSWFGKGDICIQLGEIEIRSDLVKWDSAKLLETVDLEGTVVITLREGVTIKGERAHLDLANSLVSLYGNPLLYEETHSDIKMLCEKMNFAFEESSKGIFKLEEVVAICESENSCHFSHLDDLKICAKKILYLPETEEYLFLDAEGGLNFPLAVVNNQCSFYAKKLLWNDQEKFLSFLDDVKIETPTHIKLINNDRVTFFFSKEEEREVLQSFSLKGGSYLTSSNPFELDRCFVCNFRGVAYLNHQNKEGAFISDTGSSFHYRDPMVEMNGNEVLMDYTLEQGKFLLSHLLFFDNIKLLSGEVSIDEGPAKPTQFAVADSVLYDPSLSQLRLYAFKKGRVYFYDALKNMKMSAEGLILTQKNGEEYPVVKGLGDVRFRFLEEEIEALFQKNLRKRIFGEEEQE